MQKSVFAIEYVVLVLMWLLVWEHYLRALNRRGLERGQRSKRDRTLKPRTPDDCLACRLEQELALLDTQRTARPWSEVKSRRGRPKEHDTDGQACMDANYQY